MKGIAEIRLRETEKLEPDLFIPIDRKRTNKAE